MPHTPQQLLTHCKDVFQRHEQAPIQWNCCPRAYAHLHDSSCTNHRITFNRSITLVPGVSTMMRMRRLSQLTCNPRALSPMYHTICLVSIHAESQSLQRFRLDDFRIAEFSFPLGSVHNEDMHPKGAINQNCQDSVDCVELPSLPLR